MTNLSKIKAGSLVHVRVNVYNQRVDPAVLYNPTSGVAITITNPNGTAEVTLGAMNNGSTGLYTYDWQSATDDPTGVYLVSYKAEDASGITFEPNVEAFVLT